MNSQCTTPSITSSSSRSSELDSNLTQSSITSYTSNESSFSAFNLKDTSNELSDSECEDSIEEIDIDLSCPDCSRPRPNDRWCSFCESQKFLKNNWTSGNPYLDRIIRDSQLHATSKSDYLVWIDYNDIENIEYLARGGFGEVYYGIWINGPYKVVIYDENRKSRIEGKTPVALKLLYNSVNITADFIEEHAINLPQNRGDIRLRRTIRSHPNAVYSSRLLPKPPIQKEFNREINTDETSESKFTFKR
ncbi:16440_t:CDS:2 [Gigaspora margarita]|uniref:16440_t:CDS:1 n=1 Tax=Gigaspora margarita TaxID=4874 RepID=A0ABM8W0H9_GIGMA|nr:16440_t:CDS:2 [Gigaspora margarita]